MGSGWEGISGGQHHPSAGEWQRTLRSASLFLFNSVSPLLASLDPALVAPLALNQMQCAVLVDRADNEQSYRNQSKIDTTIVASTLALRDSFSTCALLSLRGARSVAATQWNMDASSNHQRCAALVSLLTGGTPVATAVGETGVGMLWAFKSAARRAVEAKQAYQDALEASKRREAPLNTAAKPDEGGAEKTEAGAEEDPEKAALAEAVEAARTAAEEAEAALEEAQKGMRGAERALNIVVYGLPGISM